MTDLSQVEAPMRAASMQMSFPEAACTEILWLCKGIVAAAVLVAGPRPSWITLKVLDAKGSRAGAIYTRSAVVTAAGCGAKFSDTFGDGR